MHACQTVSRLANPSCAVDQCRLTVPFITIKAGAASKHNFQACMSQAGVLLISLPFGSFELLMLCVRARYVQSSEIGSGVIQTISEGVGKARSISVMRTGSKKRAVQLYHASHPRLSCMLHSTWSSRAGTEHMIRFNNQRHGSCCCHRLEHVLHRPPTCISQPRGRAATSLVPPSTSR